MDKVNQLSEALFENDLVKSNNLIKQIIAIKIQEKLQEKKIQIASSIFEGNPETKKVAKRLYRKIGKMSRDAGNTPRSITAAGRKIVATSQPEQLRAILATEDKNPSRIKNLDAEKLLKNSGYVKIRSGEHQSIWKHSTDKNKSLFPLPHHSRELSPGITRKLFSLATEERLTSEKNLSRNQL
jgi:predicted RNA binding protein YcfA (HicA-like mRNA interferase family)